MEKSKKVFGIDLGTTYSCIAYVNEAGKPETISNAENSPVTPSVVYFENAENSSVGDIAKQALETDPDNVCSTIKRQMGNPNYTFSAHGNEFKPEMVSSMILSKLAQDASDKLGEQVHRVVITCPAYFGMNEREATKTAGELAGLDVVSIINEPTAAAIAFGLKADEAQTVMVYDLGGGTFDVTIIKVSDGKIEVVATGGDDHLGGKDWDKTIRQYVIDQYVEQTGETAESIEDDTLMLGDLELKAENAKKQLSKLSKTTIRLGSARVELALDLFEAMTAGLLQASIDKTRETMKEAAAKGITSYDKILLVGGSTFMPQVKRRLEQEFAGTPIEFCDPNESVARGAAFYGENVAAYQDALKEEIEKNKQAGMTDDEAKAKAEEKVKSTPRPLGLGGESSQPIEVTNVVSKSYALRMLDENRVSRLFNFIFKNSTVPLEVPVSASTVDDNQTSVTLKVYENNYAKGQNDDIVEDNDAPTPIVEDALKPLPANLPAGAPISIIMKIDEQGLLSVDAKDETGGQTVHMEVKLTSVMTKEEKAAAKELLDYIKIR